MPSGAEVEVPIMDDVAVTGNFVPDTDRACVLVHDFTRTRAAGSLGEWCELCQGFVTRSRLMLLESPPADEAAGQ